ncbi:VWA domain-containing protein [Leisingera sp. D0M16]|uniref:vWA domain-containing protein n=1 Tax=Leisingera coralii TaxID=3351347 RepID=UPI003B7FB21D
MPDTPPLSLPDDPKLVRNITHFARALRKAGLPIGPGRVLDAVQAVAAAGFTSREDFYWALHACFVTKPEQRVVFAQVFRLFWRDPRYLEQMMAAMLPAIRGVQEERAAKPAEKRAAEALLDGMLDQPDIPAEEPEGTEIDIDASRTASAEERLRTLDFEQMSTAEIAAAKRILAQLQLPVTPIQSRRLMASPKGRRADWRRTLRKAARQGGDLQTIARAKRRIRWPNLVVLCDISGSMSQYSRIILHFLHAAANAKGAGWARVHGFTFGTRLTNITRHLHQRDVDAALAAAGAEAQDWEGGTRIGDCLHAFNRDWSRRVMGQGAVVLLISDGLDRGDPEALAREMQRLQLSSRRLIWLNPLLRWDGFAPKAQGIRAMLPYTDSFRAGHSIASLEELAQVISSPSDAGEKARLMALL